MKRMIIKSMWQNGIPAHYEILDFQSKYGVNINEVKKLYCSFKVGKRRKIKRLHIKVNYIECGSGCCQQVHVVGRIGGESFDQKSW